LTKRVIAASLAAVFFAVHTVNAYTTYDLSFTPELLYSLFYLVAILAFLTRLERDGAMFWLASLLCFALSLCSKEAAVTLPLSLFVIGCVMGYEPKRVGRLLIPHAALLGGYLIWTLGYLGVASEALASLRTRPARLDTGGYYFMIGPHLATNAATAWAWALNLPVGLLGEWRVITRSRNLVLWGFAAIQMLLLVYGLLGRARKAVLAGLALFWIAALPALPLFGHFLPYYLFLPIMGFALIVGATWNQLFETLSRRMPAAVGIGLIFVGLAFACIRSSRSDALNNVLLGRSSRIAEESLRDMQALYPTIPSGTTVFIDDDAQPDLWFHQAQGGLFRLAYRDDSLQFKYSSLKELPAAEPTASPKPIVLVYREGHLQAY
jgi:hypothetical protein